MRTTTPILAASLAATIALGAVGCVKGTPGGEGDDDDNGVYDGGALAMPGCPDITVTTIVGAEAPAVAGEGAALGAEPTPWQLRLGFSADPTGSMAILWRTDEATTVTQVQYGTSEGALDQTAEGVTYRYLPGIGGIDPPVRVHEVHLCGLEPDTQYFYRAGGAVDGGESWSPVYSFRTAPDVTEDPSAEVRIGIVGDSRDGFSVWGQLATLLQDKGVDVIMFSGDVVNIGQIQADWDIFMAAAPEVLASIPVISAHGNHDLNSVNYYSIFALPGDESDYAFDYGHAHMTVLNDSPLNVGDLGTRIAQFLNADLAGTTRPWKIVNHHRPLWSSGTRHGSDEGLRSFWGPIIDQHHADLVVAGHDHIYQRTKPLFGDEVRASTANATIYLVTGGAGAGLYNIPETPDFFSEVALKTHGAGVLSIQQDMLAGEFFDPSGTVFDQFAIAK